MFGVNGNGFQNFAKRYDASKDRWLVLAPIPRQAVIGPASVKSGKQIFLLGGMVVDSKLPSGIHNDKIVDNVYMYDIPQIAWSESNRLPKALVYSVAAETQGNIYLTGGYGGESNSNRVWAYDVKAKVWLTKESMNHSRSLHVLEAIGDKLYAIGGEMLGDLSADIVKSIETYDPLANSCFPISWYAKPICGFLHPIIIGFG